MTDRPSPEEFEGMEELRAALTRTQRQLRDAKAKSEQMVTAAYRGAKDAMLALGKVPTVPTPKRDTRKRQAEVALMHLTDWQGGKRTPSYDRDVMRTRVMRYMDRVQEITDVQRKDHPVRDAVIMFGGDMVEGCLIFPGQAFEIDGTLFDQWTTVSRLVVDVVRRALSMFERVTVIGEWGNHGRLGSRRGELARHDNLDRMVYGMARALLLPHPRLIWEDSGDDVQKVEIGAYRAVLFHGDEVGRGGFASPMTIVRHVTQWQSGAFGWPFRDAYLGHFHTHAEWPLPNGDGSVYQTGSSESDNRYAGVMLASQAKPSQRLHFIHPKAGRTTAVYKVWLS